MESSLQSISQHLRNKANSRCISSLYVVVISSTFPLFRPEDKTYVTELAVIDKSVSVSRLKFKVYLISARPHQITLNNVGQVIYLQSFVFVPRGDFYIEGRPSLDSRVEKSYDISLRMLEESGSEDKYAEHKQWFRDRFSEVFQPDIGLNRSIINQKSVVFNHFNMILRVASVGKETLGCKLTNKHTLVDQYSNQFLMSFPVAFQPNCDVLITDIKLIQNSFNIVLTETSNVLQLPLPFKTKFYRCICSDDTNYNHVTPLTTIKSTLFVQQDSITNLRELANNAKNFLKGNKMIQGNEHYFTMDREYSQKEHVIQVYPVSIQCQIKLFNGEFMVDEEQLRNESGYQDNNSYVWGKKYKYVYLVRFMMKDPSLDHGNQCVEIDLFNWDSNGDQFFPNIDLNGLNDSLLKKLNEDYMKIQEDSKQGQTTVKHKPKNALDDEEIYEINAEKSVILGKLEEWAQRIQRQTASNKLMTLIVEPINTKFELKYRIVNSWLNHFE